MNETRAPSTHLSIAPPAWALARPKPIWRSAVDLLGAPLRMVLLPDHVCERLGLTSLRAERLSAVLPVVHGRLLDVGAGDNVLVQLHRQSGRDGAAESVGVDVVDWGGGCLILESTAHLPFDDASFDTVAFVACLNHIPERRDALAQAHRVLKPGGTLVVTMIGRLIGSVGHRLWWYSEEKHRDVAEEEEMGLDRAEVVALLADAGFTDVRVTAFLYGLNTLYVARR